jgi:hypothetical protein
MRSWLVKTFAHRIYCRFSPGSPDEASQDHGPRSICSSFQLSSRHVPFGECGQIRVGEIKHGQQANPQLFGGRVDYINRTEL